MANKKILILIGIVYFLNNQCCYAQPPARTCDRSVLESGIKKNEECVEEAEEKSLNNEESPNYCNYLNSVTNLCTSNLMSCYKGPGVFREFKGKRLFNTLEKLISDYTSSDPEVAKKVYSCPIAMQYSDILRKMMNPEELSNIDFITDCVRNQMSEIESCNKGKITELRKSITEAGINLDKSAVCQGLENIANCNRIISDACESDSNKVSIQNQLNRMIQSAKNNLLVIFGKELTRRGMDIRKCPNMSDLPSATTELPAPPLPDLSGNKLVQNMPEKEATEEQAAAEEEEVVEAEPEPESDANEEASEPEPAENADENEEASEPEPAENADENAPAETEETSETPEDADDANAEEEGNDDGEPVASEDDKESEADEGDDESKDTDDDDSKDDDSDDDEEVDAGANNVQIDLLMLLGLASLAVFRR